MYASDIKLSDGIAVSYYAYHNHRAKVEPLVSMVKKAVPEYRKLLNFGKVTIRIAPLKGIVRGRYWDSTSVVEIDSRLDPAIAIETLAHELVHAEQYHTGRLEQRKVNGKWMRSWQGEMIKMSKSYEAYRALPWEAEAFGRQVELASAVRELVF